VTTSTSLPLGAVLSAAAALVFAAPTLFLPADTHASVKLVFIAVGSILFAMGVIRVRSEGRAKKRSDTGASSPDDLTPE